MFDQKALEKNKYRAADNIVNSDFFNFIHLDLIDRAAIVHGQFNKKLLISYFPKECLVKYNFTDCDIVKPNELHLITNKYFDIIYFPFGLHFVNDITNFLVNVKSYLCKKGVLIGNFAGFGSLIKLKNILLKAEEQSGNHHFPHIAPFLKFEDVSRLLQSLGFIENIIDYENLILEHKSPISLMKWLKNMGESNIISNRQHYSINKKLYKLLNSFDEELFEEQIKLITFVSSPIKGSIGLYN